MSGHSTKEEALLPLNAQPGDVEMDRSEAGLNPAPPQESLRDKLMAHYQKGMKKHKQRKLTNPLTPEIINKVAVPFFLFTVFASYKIGFVDVMPLMYGGYDHVIFLQRCLISLFFLEMMVNWLGIRYVDSTYIRYLRLYGPPSHERVQLGGGAGLLVSNGQNLEKPTASLMPIASQSLKGKENGFPNLTTNITTITPAGEMIRANSLSLKQEVDLANEQMDKRNSQINNKSIDDLLTSSHKHNRPASVSSLHQEKSSSLFSNQEDARHVEQNHPENKSSTTLPGSSVTSPTPVVTTNGNVVTQAYPYWSWVPCYACGRARPPRCHHCPLCKACVLKRDHHCFFAGNCVGYRNHRFFYIFLVWAWTGCMYATLHGFPYIWFFLWPEMTYMDVLFPVAIIRFLLGYTHFQAALSVTTLTFLIYFDVLAGTFIYDHAWLISRGLTSFEKAFLKNSLEIRDTRTLARKLRSVFGPHWLISFLLPVHFLTEPEEDPVMWPDIQVFKQ